MMMIINNDDRIINIYIEHRQNGICFRWKRRKGRREVKDEEQRDRKVRR
jgi:hypothetical protein